MSENIGVFRIPGVTSETIPVIETIPAPIEPTPSREEVAITPDMRIGVEDYVVAYETPYSDTQRAIALSMLKHAFFLRSGRHARR